jgi:hypothetical protein
LLGLLGGEHRFAEDDEKVPTSAILGKAQEAKPVISTAMANPETIFSERDMFMRFLRSLAGLAKARPEAERCCA